MRQWKTGFWLSNIGTLYYLLVPALVTAQIVPDATLPNNSLVDNQNNVSTINGGTQVGSNLFQSFEQFSVPSNSAAYFNNSLDIQNIFSRVTGSSISNIDGLLKANGTANLFIINPNGIILGPNSRLNINGSFLASTANSINFADGTQFNTDSPQVKPLLSISAPVGLQFGNSPSTIRVQGTGHSLTIPVPFFSPILNTDVNSNGLQVAPERTIALVGGDISLEGGVITAPGGRIELGSVGSGVVTLNPFSSGWILGYNNTQDFRDIKLSQQSLVDASGLGGSSIQVVGRQISLVDGSIALIQNYAPRDSGGVIINAFESLDLSGTTLDGKISSGLQTETLQGFIGDIVVSTKQLRITDGAAINAKTFTQASSSNIILKATNFINVVGFSNISNSANSGIGNYTLSSGNSGEIAIDTGLLTVLDGGTIIAGTFGTGRGGELTINASQGIHLKGFNPIMAAPSQLAVGTFGTGNTGNMRIKTPTIILQNGGNINSYTLFSGKAGNITIDASNSIEIIPAIPGELVYALPFGISSFAAPLPDATRELLRVPLGLSGDSGDITINAKRITAASNTLFEVSNLGTGRAGKLAIHADSISLKDGANIAASTASGEGGDIFLQARSIQLVQNSSINATASDPEIIATLPITSTATGTGDGGNIIVNTDVLAILENSDISANAFQGNGGNIKIKTQGLFVSPNSSITASSELGVDGTVQINILDTAPISGLVNSPIVTVDSSRLIAQDCLGNENRLAREKSEFIITGRGGLPPQPNEPLRAEAIVVDKNTLKAEEEHRLMRGRVTRPISSTRTQIVEAQGWVINERGEVILTAQPVSTTLTSSRSTQVTCYAP